MRAGADPLGPLHVLRRQLSSLGKRNRPAAAAMASVLMATARPNLSSVASSTARGRATAGSTSPEYKRAIATSASSRTP